MKDILFRRKIGAQVKKMLTDKWDEGCRINRDPGPAFLRHWPEEHGAEFHENWMKSLCRTCVHCDECGFKAAGDCRYYLADRSVDPEG